MNFKFLLITLVVIACCYISRAQNTVQYCNVPIDSTAFDTIIQSTMLNGTAQEVANAIDTGKKDIDTAIGCGRESYNCFLSNSKYGEPSTLQVIHDWSTFQEEKFDTLLTDCPGAGRNTASIALGGYYARLAGFPVGVGLDTLNITAENFLQAQYDSSHAPTPLAFAPGVYGYLDLPSTDSCFVVVTADNDITNHYLSPTPYKVNYNKGAYSTDSFFVSDYDTSTFWLWGGLSYDQAWITAMMIQAATQQNNPTYKTEYTNSAIESANWAMQEPPEILSQPTADCIWMLADMYDWTGNKAYYNNMVDKLNRGVLPSVLTDFIKPGYVDGMNNKPFSSLTPLAQHPGRLWGPGDAVPWNTALCANGVVEAYVASRDRGDDSEAQALKPYVNAMLDNICWQVNNLGIFSLSVLYRDIDYTVINAIWKIEKYENDPHPGWDSTAWALYNGNLAKYFGLPTVDIALYLLVLNDVPYQPLATGIASPVVNNMEQAEVYPNPSDGNSTLKFFVTTPEQIAINITDITGQVVANLPDEEFNTGQHALDLNYQALSAGMYFIWLHSERQNKVLKWVKNY